MTAAVFRSAADLLGGGVGLLVAVALTFLATMLLAVMLFGARARRRPARELARRIGRAPGVAGGAFGRSTEEPATRFVPPALAAAGERVARATGLLEWLERTLERAAVPVAPGELVALAGVASFAVAAVVGLLTGNVLLVLALAGAAAVAPPAWVGLAARRRAARLHEHLADSLMVLASALRAGHSFFQALDMVAKEIADPASSEFGRVVSEIRLGRPVDDAMNAMADRVGSVDFRWAVLAVNVQREVGGNLAEVLETVAETIRERDALRRQIDVLSAEGRLSKGILTTLPFLIGLYIAVVNPGYMNLLFTTRLGLIMLVTAGCLMTVGVVWMRKVVKIDV